MTTWQFNVRHWYWPWHTSSYDMDFDLYAHFAGIGPFQFHWWSKKS